MYEKEVRKGGVLVIVRTREDHADQVADILADAGARDVDERAEPATVREESGGIRTSSAEEGRSGGARRRETSIPVVEEELKVGKRDVRRGGVRVYPYVQERPVEQQIRLHDETIKVDRRPADRPASDSELKAFEEGTIELTETGEEPVVTKSARVVEEVVVSVEERERTERIRDTVKRGDVEIERIDPVNEDDFRRHFESRNPGGSYDEYAPAYQFGHVSASDPRYKNARWAAVEPDLKRDWESKGRSSWERFKDSIRYGWERIRH
jgi:uncharacterized protein (TIGR02271 family)